MPIYNYKCPKCGIVVERIQGYEDDPPSCPENVDENECGDPSNPRADVLERIMGAPNAHFKGGGFHSTDYKDSKNPAS